MDVLGVQGARGLYGSTASPRNACRVWGDKFPGYGLRKAWRRVLREEIAAACRTEEPLTRMPGRQGVTRGKERRMARYEGLRARHRARVYCFNHRWPL